MLIVDEGKKNNMVKVLLIIEIYWGRIVVQNVYEGKNELVNNTVFI